MTQNYRIPLTLEPQRFTITLAAKEYRLTVRWLDVDEGGWLLDIQEPENSEPIIMGIPLVTGVDLLEQYAYLEFGGQLWVDSEMPPTLDNLGTDVELIFVVEDE